MQIFDKHGKTVKPMNRRTDFGCSSKMVERWEKELEKYEDRLPYFEKFSGSRILDKSGKPYY